jgi:hypothetical protein
MIGGRAGRGNERVLFFETSADSLREAVSLSLDRSRLRD